MTKLRLLQLVGSPVDEFHCDLSRLYAQGCLDAAIDPTCYESYLAYISPNQQWRFPEALSPEALAAAEPMALPEALHYLSHLQIDIALPQMFCLPGMTHYRALLELLAIPYIGNTAAVMALTANKAKTKAIVAAAGVSVPHGQRLSRQEILQGVLPKIPPPAIVKPATSDNSLGTTLVNAIDEYPTALETACTFGEDVLVEEFIELGREVRCGIIVRDGELIPLPLEEYPLNPSDCPIRTYDQKLKRDAQGNLTCVAKDPSRAWIVNPSDPISATVWEAAKRCHREIGCRHYSLFDFRIDPQEQPYFLEAGLYCSFSPKSVIVTMAGAAGIPLPDLLQFLAQPLIHTGRTVN
jgi:D-alanine-D-alanine ligase